MIDPNHRDSAEPAELTERDLAIAALVGRYIERREHTRRRASTTCSPRPPSSATPRATSCAPCWPAMRRCAPTATGTRPRPATERISGRRTLEAMRGPEYGPTVV